MNISHILYTTSTLNILTWSEGTKFRDPVDVFEIPLRTLCLHHVMPSLRNVTLGKRDIGSRLCALKPTEVADLLKRVLERGQPVLGFTLGDR